MNDNWIEDESRIGGYYRRGFLGKNCLCSNSHRIQIKSNYNGSGDTAFNGSTSWPVLEVHVSFEEGQKELAGEIALRIAEIIDELLPVPDEE